jgi:hypothetical protein
MKKMKIILSLAILTLFIVGCNDVEQASQDASSIISPDNYPTPTFTLSGGALTANEYNETVYVYDIVTDRAINRDFDVSFEQVGGNATLHDDYDVTNATVRAFSTTGQMTVTIHNDTEVEGTETLTLQLISGPSLANKYLINPNTDFPSLNLTIEDWVFCTWTLETSDTYGDGWNGGFIELTTDDAGTTTYAADDDEADVFDIAITDGVDFSFTYVSGGGTGAGPGWESENYFKLTAPDGTEWVGGTQDYSGIPTPGVITSGTNDCP